METVKHWLSKSWVFVLLGGILAILVFPYAASAYHLEAGGRALDQIGESANPHLQSAIRHLQSAIRWDAENAQAYRLLGRAYLAQGDLVAAAEALTRFTELRPDNPLGHIELAGVYETMDAELEAHTRYDFLTHLPEARIETAGFWIKTLFCEEGDPPEKCYVGETAFQMPDDAAARPTLFMHAPSRASYTVTLPAEPAVLSFGIGLQPMTWTWGGDGVTFEVFVDDGAGEQQVLAKRLDIPAAREGWHEEQVDLGSYAGRTVTLTLSVIPGPEWEMTGDWAGWGEPRIVDAAALPLVTLRPAEQMVREWKAAGLTAQDFIARGEEERKAKRYEEALRWYERAARVTGERLDVIPDYLHNQSPVVLESFATTSAWKPCPWCENVVGRFEANKGVLEMSYRNTLGKRDKFAFLSVSNVPINNFSELLLRLKGDPGTLLTMEIVVDGERSRPINYQPAPEDWSVWTVPIRGFVLNEIAIGIGESEPVLTPAEYHLSVDWIALR